MLQGHNLFHQSQDPRGRWSRVSASRGGVRARGRGFGDLAHVTRRAEIRRQRSKMAALNKLAGTYNTCDYFSQRIVQNNGLI